jgi:hypothetical protein
MLFQRHTITKDNASKKAITPATIRVLGEKRSSIRVFFSKERKEGQNDQFLISEVAKNEQETEIKPIDCYLCV